MFKCYLCCLIYSAKTFIKSIYFLKLVPRKLYLTSYHCN